MKVILVLVSTLNGKITRGDDPEVRHWSSESDQEYYRGIWKSSNLVVMGSNTFRLNRISPSPGRLVVVMTRNPSEFSKYMKKGQIEFLDDPPESIVKRFASEGYEKMTVVGGSQVAASFLNAKLIDELWLTIEPRLFGRGTGIIPEGENLDISFRLISYDLVNKEGTMIMKYAVIRDSLIR